MRSASGDPYGDANRRLTYSSSSDTIARGVANPATGDTYRRTRYAYKAGGYGDHCPGCTYGYHSPGSAHGDEAPGAAYCGSDHATTGRRSA